MRALAGPILFVGACLAVPMGAKAQAVEENVVVGMYSGLALTMDVHRPQVGNGFAVVFIGGSGWQRPLAWDAPRLSEGGASLRAALLEEGYTVFALNHRASPRFQFPAQIEDVQRAVRFIRSQAEAYSVDPTRIAAVGGSSGGHLALLLGMLDGDGDPHDADPINRLSAKVQVVAAWYAPADLASIDTPGGMRGSSLLIGAGLLNSQDSGSREARMYRDASPVTFVSSEDPPTLLIHGDADATIPFTQSQMMHAALVNAGVETRLIPVPGGAHGASTPEYIGPTIDWIGQHLPSR